MLAALALTLVALRAGLALRRARAERRGGLAKLRAQHLRFARPAVCLLCLGFAGGALSSWWLRAWTPFTRLHGWLGLLSLALFVAVAALGRRLEHGKQSAREAHATAALAAVLAAALSAVAGFVLLP